MNKSYFLPFFVVLYLCVPLQIAFILSARADVTLPSIFSDHAVLQSSEKVPVWGTASPGETVKVMLGSASASAQTSPVGKWEVALNLRSVGKGPFEMVVQGQNRLTVADVIVGEVWLCSGQSNMELPMTQVTDSTQEIAESADTALRQFLVVKKFSPTPMGNAAGKWMIASPETTGQFTAAGYFFGRQLRKRLDQPVGLINTTWGGTEVEAWTSAEALDKDPELKDGKNRAIAQRVAFDGYVPAYQAWQKKYAREDHPVPDPAAFAAPDIPMDSWKKVTLPGMVSSVGLPASGAVWIRREIMVEPDKANRAFDLFLGDLRDIAQIYWNGKKIAESNTGSIEHRYNIPANLVTAGKGLLAVRIYHPADGLGIAPGNTRFRYGGNQSLQGDWFAKAEYELPALDPKAMSEFPRRPTLPLPANRVASWLFNAMISPLIPYEVRGFLWYQGEQNAGQGFQYRSAFPLLIQDWRSALGQRGHPLLLLPVAQL